jgi:hypothetical protein
MPIVKKIEGDLFDAKETWILQQCNCVTVRSQGLSASIDRKWGVNPYCGRRLTKEMDVPGTIKIMDSDDGTKKIICAFAQWAPGKPGHYEKFYSTPPQKDTMDQRLSWFEECLSHLDIDGKVAVPYKIGCGLAGGNWKDYKRVLIDSDVQFVIYKL